MFLHYVSIAGLIRCSYSTEWHVHLLELLTVCRYYPLKILFLFLTEAKIP